MWTKKNKSIIQKDFCNDLSKMNVFVILVPCLVTKAIFCLVSEWMFKAFECSHKKTKKQMIL